jgi:4-hydroxy-tetrahydrodipicolinate reductase
MSISLLISGITGKLGKAVAEELNQSNDIFLAGGLASTENLNLGKPLNTFLNTDSDAILTSDLNSFKNQVDIVLDVSSVENFDNLIDFCGTNNLPLILASTGHTERQIKLIEKYSLSFPILVAPNLSVGINLLKKSLLSFKKNKLIKKIIIKETHHKEKKDSPSGTAKDLSKFINEELNLDIKTNIVSIRDESTVGIHEIKIIFASDEIVITHKANNRKIFAEGAIKAVEWISCQKPGLYTMQEISF